MAWSNHILSAFWRALPRLVAVVVLGSIALPLGATKGVHAAGCYVRGAPLFVSSKNFAEHDVALTESGATIKAYIGNTLGTGTRTWDVPGSRLCSGDQAQLTVRAGGQLELLSRFWTTSGNQTLDDLRVGLSSGFPDRNFPALAPGGDLGGMAGARAYQLTVTDFRFSIGVWVRSSQGDAGLVAWSYVPDNSAAPVSVQPAAPPAPIQPVAALPADPDQALRDAFRACPGSFDSYALLRQMNADENLVLDVSQTALADMWPRGSVIGGFVDKVGSALGSDETDHLGWLLTENATPRYPSNPYVQLTPDRDQLDDGELSASFESALADRIATSAGNLQPNDVLKLALDVTAGDYPLAMLTTHNLLKELTYASRPGGGSALLGWDGANRGTDTDAITLNHAGYDVRAPAEVQGLIGKLSSLREANDPFYSDKMGPWYHLYGVLFVGSVTTGSEATFGAWFENFTRWLKLGSEPDPTKEFVNTCAGQLARYVAGLPAQEPLKNPDAAASF